MMDASLWKDRAARRPRPYQPRYRRDCRGELVQVDGSKHWWFEDRGPQCTLLVSIDHATSELILDNLPAHKSVAACAAIKERGSWLLFLPPYSPEFNPIENAFAKLKAHQRKAAARTVDDLSRAIDTFTPTEYANYFVAARYDAYRSEFALDVPVQAHALYSSSQTWPSANQRNRNHFPYNRAIVTCFITTSRLVGLSLASTVKVRFCTRQLVGTMNAWLTLRPLGCPMTCNRVNCVPF